VNWITVEELVLIHERVIIDAKAHAEPYLEP